MPNPEVLERPTQRAPKPPQRLLNQDHLGQDHLQPPKTQAPKPPKRLLSPKERAPRPPVNGLVPPRTLAPKPPKNTLSSTSKELVQSSSPPENTLSSISDQLSVQHEEQKTLQGNNEVSEQVYSNDSRMPTESRKNKVVGKYGLALTSVGVGQGVGMHLDGNGGGLGSSFVTGGLGMVQGGLGLYYSGQRKEESNLYGDQGGKKLSEDEVKNNSLGLLQSGVGVGKTSLQTTSLVQNGKQGLMTMSDFTGKTSGMVSTGLTIGTEVLGIAGHVISGVQSGYELFCATSKLWPNTKSKLHSTRGQAWRARIMERQKVKSAMQTLKLLAAGIGIAGGVLVLASNPVGWALGIAAAAVGGAFALGKVVHTIRDTYKRRKGRKELEKNGELGLSKQELDEREKRTTSQDQDQKDPKKSVSQEERDRVKDMADRVAAMVSQNAKVAREMHLAAKNGEQPFLEEKARLSRLNVREVPDIGQMSTEAQEYFDVGILAKLLNLDVKQVGSSSGTELLESKISALNGT